MVGQWSDCSRCVWETIAGHEGWKIGAEVAVDLDVSDLMTGLMKCTVRNSSLLRVDSVMIECAVISDRSVSHR